MKMQVVILITVLCCGCSADRQEGTEGDSDQTASAAAPQVDSGPFPPASTADELYIYQVDQVPLR